MHDFERLDVYRDAMTLTVKIVAFAERLPRSQRFGLGSQLQRSSISVPSNIAEGAGRGDRADFARFIRIAIGSLCEADCQLDICARVGFGDAEVAQRIRGDVNTLRRKLYRFEKTLRSHPD